MCGRYTLHSNKEAIAKTLGLADVPQLSLRFNVAPTQQVATIRAQPERELVLMRWGLIPHWAKDPSIGNRMINARSETVATKPSFRSAFKSRRCLVVVDGFYEWKKTAAKKKQPYYIRMKDEEPFAFAGLWESWQDMESCTILTTRPNELMKNLHDRMPVILSSNDYCLWLDPTLDDREQLESLLVPCPSSDMKAYPVSTTVNSPKNDRPECIEEVCEE